MQSASDANWSIKAEVLHSIDPRYFHLIIFPTEKCSFRCSYCYEDFASGKMSSTVVNALKKLIDARTRDVTDFEISWFGGEPLLASDIVLNVQDYVLSLSRNFAFSANMTTNGFHLNPMLGEKLVNAHVRTFQISLDGQREQHNKTRIGKGDFPTFDRIWRNLIALKHLNTYFQVILRIHFHPSNIESIERLSEDIISEFSDDGRFKVYFKNINHLGGSNDNEFVVFNHTQQKSIKHQLEARFLEKSMLHSGASNYICYASRLNSLAIRADGRIAKCTVALNDDKNTVGTLQDDGRISIDRAKLNVWVRGLETENELELQCPLHANP